MRHNTWAAIAVAGALLGCGGSLDVPAPVRTGGSPPATPLARAKAPIDGLRLVREIFTAKEVQKGYEVDAGVVAEAAAAGVDASNLHAAMEQLFAECFAERAPERCTIDDPVVEPLLALAGEMASPRSIPFLMRLEAKGIGGSDAHDRILLREMSRNLGACTPPSAEEVARERARLADFAVVVSVDDELTARALTPAEADDLAYFMAAVAEAGPPVGEGLERAAPSPTPPPPPEADVALRAALLERIDTARKNGDVAAMAEAARHYLATLGFPKPIRAHEEAEYAWGGARFSYVMRDLAFASEILGDVELAADLYRRADPGGGACGTSTDYRRGEQTMGLIRAAERAGQCRSIVAERLLDWQGQMESLNDPTARAAGYGPARLADAGWDVIRLYRGALLTRNREGDAASLVGAFDGAPEPLRSEARRRLERAGPEAWEERVRAAEGLADVGGRPALDELLARLNESGPALRERMITAIGRMAARPGMGVCDDELGWLSLGSISTAWSRPVRSFGTNCHTLLDDEEANALSRRLSTAIAHPAFNVRYAAVDALREVAAPASIARMEEALAASTRVAATCKADDNSTECWESRAMIEQLERALESMRRQRDEAAAASRAAASTVR